MSTMGVAKVSTMGVATHLAAKRRYHLLSAAPATKGNEGHYSGTSSHGAWLLLQQREMRITTAAQVKIIIIFIDHTHMNTHQDSDHTLL